MNYIGSKYSLLDFLDETIYSVTGYQKGQNFVFADLFSGTSVVGAHFRENGCKVIANDLQYYSYALSKHYIESNDNISDDTLNLLNGLEGTNGFVYKNYCSGSGCERNYFTDENGRKCDAIREKIEEMRTKGEISDPLYFSCLAALINSIDKYANTASVYGAFLKHLKKSAAKSFVLEPLKVVSGPIGEVYNEDINDVITHVSGDVLYLDPPYNTRQYCSNYHVLETIARNDNPKLRGKTGLREDNSLKSKYCSKRTLTTVFDKLISDAKFKYIFLSYNNEGLMSLDKIREIMSRYGEYSYYTKEYKRFKADKDENRNISGDKTIEYLHCLIKE